MERNFETVMVEQCAPVLAGLKPANLFRHETLQGCMPLGGKLLFVHAAQRVVRSAKFFAQRQGAVFV